MEKLLYLAIKDHAFIRVCERTICNDMKFNKVKHGRPERQSGSLTYWFR